MHSARAHYEGEPVDAGRHLAQTVSGEDCQVLPWQINRLPRLRGTGVVDLVVV